MLENISAEHAKCVLETFSGYKWEKQGALLLQTFAKKSHVSGEFTLGYCSEFNDNVLTYRENELLTLNPSWSYDIGFPDGSYIVASGGPGWFLWGIGCPLASAITETLIDSSIPLETGW